MVFTKIFLVGVAIVVFMVVARDQQWPQRAGVTGSCVATRGPSGSDAGAWYACRQGVLTGFPNLEGNSCTSEGIVTKQEIWQCPEPLVSLPGY